LRAAWARKVAAGGVLCAHCGLPILPGEAWDLGHDDTDRRFWTGPEHRRCNRATSARASSRRQPTYAENPAMYQDDPEEHVFWGPPNDRGIPIRWSRHWYDWRPEELAG
jgi:hypothetical protein